MSDARHQTWNLWVAYGLMFVLLPLAGALLIHVGRVADGDSLTYGPETCRRALERGGSSADLQRYELRACEAAGVDLRARDAHWVRGELAGRYRPTPAELAAIRRTAARYHRATFCATPGLSCDD